MIKIGIAVFAYNRSEHLKKVLEGLKKNDDVSKLYIFQDGLKKESHRKKWEETSQIIEETTWCEKLFFKAEKNKGLSRSILDGINKVLEDNDAVIVLEDDCVPNANFIDFMKKCFEKYKDKKKVWSVSGYAWPIELPGNDSDIYFCGRISSWGWGTWKDRWVNYEKDYSLIRALKNDRESSLNLALWGSDLENMLINNIAGINDSWAVFWALNVIANKGYCINPYQSLIENIGCDGTGEHCGVSNHFDVSISVQEKSDFNFPKRIEVLDSTKAAFADLYGSYTAIEKSARVSEAVLVYGIGQFFRRYEKEINNKYNIVAFIDRKKDSFYAGKPIIKKEDICNMDYDKIIIMIQNANECTKIIRELCDEHGVNEERVISIFGGKEE